jgi:hypothetical protein
LADLTYRFPALGEVHNYEYLFAHEHDAGLEDGRKARPVLVIAAAPPRVFVMAITTRGEIDGARTISIPIEVARAMGLPRPEESALLVDEVNSFDWVGHDIRPVPGTTSSRFGRATPRFVSAALGRFRASSGRSIRRS